MATYPASEMTEEGGGLEVTEIKLTIAGGGGGEGGRGGGGRDAWKADMYTLKLVVVSPLAILVVVGVPA
jgi:hypothetical protein